MRGYFARWQRYLVLPIAAAANTALAAVPVPDLANIDWQKTGLLAAVIGVGALVVAWMMRGFASSEPDNEGHLRRIGNMPVEPGVPAEASEMAEARRRMDDELDPRSRIESKLPGYPV